MNKILQKGNPLHTSVVSILLSVLMTIILFIIFSFILGFFSYPGMLIKPSVIAASCIGVFLCVYYTSGAIESKGWLYGVLCAAGYILILVLAGMFFRRGNNAWGGYYWMMPGIILSGFIGGVMGINKTSSSFKK